MRKFGMMLTFLAGTVWFVQGEGLAKSEGLPWSAGYATGLISGNGFSLGLPIGSSQLQLVAGAFYFDDLAIGSYSLGVNFKPQFFRFELSKDTGIRLYGVVGGSVFTGVNINWIGYGLLYAPLVTSSLASYLLVSELTGISLSTEPSLAAGLGFGIDVYQNHFIHVAVEPVVAGLGNLSRRSFQGLRFAIQSTIYFDL